ncbi:hypothetical protein HMI01_20240 [Halolactibacillus miurensis]|uniref:Uncharacterized protein n=1 Tax=Halolactibacillus miurensis TaxID=306541 RepID=A0A1I6U8X4_9BACI|nr:MULTISPECIES: hypothetical protein [Halolactibacillus]GEM05036.1 hypothetical protein HMI01_20240 [Halolactibacillus miurensis]SFS97916.1 hypothetical protein SAMN05421668_12325 [Halolactibacillus miurensis]
MERLTSKLFNENQMSSAIIFYGVVVLYTLIIDVKIDVKKILIILFFTVLFWILNSTKITKK